MIITQLQLIQKFIDGQKEGRSGSPENPGNLKILGDQLIHYETPIIERYKKGYIFNNTRYSLQTGLLQKKAKSVIDESQRTDIKQVPAGYKGSLVDFIK